MMHLTLSATSSRKYLPLLAGDPTGLTQINRRMGQTVHTFNPPLYNDAAIGARAGEMNLNVRLLRQHDSPPLCWVGSAGYSKPT
jgi:hypothetical protein